MFSDELIALATEVLAAARAGGVKIATAESCTGGLIAGLLTEIPGSSDVVDRGFVTYSNAAKEAMLGVDPQLLREHGAVSKQVAKGMAQGALQRSRAHIAIAVTGIAGPGGGTAEKPVGLVYLAHWSRLGNEEDVGLDYSGGGTLEARFGDIGRTQVRLGTVEMALKILLTSIESRIQPP